MKILGLDSSGLVAGVAVVTEENLLGEYTVNYKKTHSQTLLPMLDEVARMIELDLNTIDAIAVARGPGSFTGLRIGSATAKGLGFALDKPVIAVPTVDALAYNLVGNRDVVCPLMDARRNQTYTGIYRFDGTDMEVLTAQCAVPIEEIISKLNQYHRQVVFLGDGVPVFRDMIAELITVPYTFAPPHLNKQRAGAVAALGLLYYGRGEYQSAEEHRPEYLRLSQAERERREGKAKIGVRAMQQSDVGEVAAIERGIFSRPWSEKGFADALLLSCTVFVVAEENGRILGYVGMYISGEEGEITNVAVMECERNRGIGGILFDALIKEAKQRGVQKAVLEVRTSNTAALHFYEKRGFTRCGRRKNFYEAPVEDAYIMFCTL